MVHFYVQLGPPVECLERIIILVAVNVSGGPIDRALFHIIPDGDS